MLQHRMGVTLASLCHYYHPLPLRYMRSFIGDLSFSVAAARVWNSLPADVTSAPSLLVFRRMLKTELCLRSFPDN